MNLNQPGVYKVMGSSEWSGIDEPLEDERTVSANNAEHAIKVARSSVVGSEYEDEPETGDPVKRVCEAFTAHVVEFVTKLDVV